MRNKQSHPNKLLFCGMYNNNSNTICLKFQNNHVVNVTEHLNKQMFTSTTFHVQETYYVQKIT